MLYNSQAKKNKHQNNYETISELYLYKDHKIAKNLSIKLSKETRAELDDDIFAMRRHFRYSLKKLKRDLYDSDNLRDLPEMVRTNERAKLRSRRAAA